MKKINIYKAKAFDRIVIIRPCTYEEYKALYDFLKDKKLRFETFNDYLILTEETAILLEHEFEIIIK
jgi:hypothetical protein